MENIWCKYSPEYLEKLRREYELEGLVSNCGSCFDKIVTVAKWVSGLWEHVSYGEPDKRDPYTILEQVTKQGKRFRCVEYGIVTAGCLNALGIPARSVVLKTEDSETRDNGAAHVVCEAYDTDRESWLCIDVQCGAVPLVSGEPVSVYRLGKALDDDSSELSVMWINDRYGMTDGEYFGWVGDYIYDLDSVCWAGGKSRRIMFVPEGGREVRVFQKKYNVKVDRYLRTEAEFYSLDPGTVLGNG